MGTSNSHNGQPEKGIVVIRDGNNKVFLTDIFDTPEKGRDLWHSWVDVARRHDHDGQKRTAVELYDVPDVENFTDWNDKQIALAMDGLRPDMRVKAIEAEFAARNGADAYNPDAVAAAVRRTPARFRRFLEHCNPIMARLNKLPMAEIAETCRAQRVFTMKGGFSFTGRDSVRSPEDVAWIFRQLSEKAVENLFCYMQRGKEQLILHVGMGNINSCLSDAAAICEAAERFNADRVWFVHNHPSGEVNASREDRQLWYHLKEMLGRKLQDGIIINTNTGKYGVFDKWDADARRFGQQELFDNVEHEIPVYSFDSRVFSDKKLDYADRTITRAADIAEFFSTQRFGERSRYGFLLMDVRGKVIGNMPLADTTFDHPDETARIMMRAAFSTGAVRVAVYGKPADGVELDKRKVMYLGDAMNRYSGGSVRLIDFVLQRGQGTDYYSYEEEGILQEPAADYGRQKGFDSIEIIPVKGGQGMLRVSIDGRQLPAERVRPADMKRLAEGSVTRERLAEQYFSKEHPWLKQVGSTGLKR